METAPASWTQSARCRWTTAELKDLICGVKPAALKVEVESLELADLVKLCDRLRLVLDSYRGNMDKMRKAVLKLFAVWKKQKQMEEEEEEDSVEEEPANRRLGRSSSRVLQSPPPARGGQRQSAREPSPLDQDEEAILASLPHVQLHSSPSPRRRAPAAASRKVNAAAAPHRPSVLRKPSAASSSSAARNQYLSYSNMERYLQDSSDDDADLDGDGASAQLNMALSLEENGLRASFADSFINNVRQCYPGQSVHSVFLRDTAWKSDRNKKEGLALAAIIDAARRGDMQLVLETAARRLAGVHTGDSTGNWKMCDVFELNTQAQSFVPSGFMQMALKHVQRMQAVEKSASASSSSAASRSKGAGAGQGREYKKDNYKKDGSNGGASGASAAAGGRNSGSSQK